MPYVANFIDDIQSKINNVFREALPHPRGDAGLHQKLLTDRGSGDTGSCSVQGLSRAR